MRPGELQGDIRIGFCKLFIFRSLDQRLVVLSLDGKRGFDLGQYEIYLVAISRAPIIDRIETPAIDQGPFL